MFREYSPAQGRWVSPDPAGLTAVNLTDPQSWNRYVYATNRPLDRVDPLGLDSWSFVGNCSLHYSSVITTAPDGTIHVDLLLDFVSCDPGPGSGPPTPFDGGGLDPTGTSNPDNSGFTLGVRAPGETYMQCLASTSSAYSIAGVFNIQSEAGKFALGNDVSQTLFGDTSEGTGGLAVWEAGSLSVQGGVGEAMTAGRRTASIFDLNLAGKTGPAAKILGKTGAEKLAGWLTGVAELKMAADVGLTGAQAIGCLIHP